RYPGLQVGQYQRLYRSRRRHSALRLAHHRWDIRRLPRERRAALRRAGIHAAGAERGARGSAVQTLVAAERKRFIARRRVELSAARLSALVGPVLRAHEAPGGALRRCRSPALVVRDLERSQSLYLLERNCRGVLPVA